jgi:hypothetical protein
VNPETGSYSFSYDIPPGTYTVEVYNGPPAGVKLGERSGIQVRAGETVMADIDLTSTAGKVVGAIQVNGAGHLAGISVAIPPYGASGGADSSGNFAVLLPPGTGYTANVGAGCGSLGTFGFDITAGLTTYAGTHDFAAGDLQGTVKWNGTPVSAWAEDFVVAADGLPPAPGLMVSRETGSYSVEDCAPGTYALKVFVAPPVAALLQVGGPRSASVSAGATTTADIDVNSKAGEVTGVIKLNGSPHHASISIPLEPAPSVGFGSDPDGNFAILLPQGSYTANVGAGCDILGTFPFDITAGLTTDAGTHDLEAGNLQGTVKWNGTPVSAWAEDFVVFGGGLPVLPVSRETGSYSVEDCAPGTHTLNVFVAPPFAPELQVGGPVAADVSAGVTTTADIDLNSKAGRVTGVIKVNGNPHPAVISIPLPEPVPPLGFGSDPDGNFAILLPEGSYTAQIRSPANPSLLGTFGFSVSAGDTTDVHARDFPAGNLQGTVRWKGTPVSAWAEDFYIHAGPIVADVDRGTASYSAQDIAPGPYTATVFAGRPDGLQVGGPVPVGISAGGTTTADIDLALWTGEVAGVIRKDDAPYVAQILVPIGPGFMYSWSDSSGNFAILLLEGDYMAVVHDPSNGSLLGTFGFHITAGQTVRTLQTSQTIGIGGGTVRAYDDSVTVTVPPGALPEPVTISLTATQDPSFQLTVPGLGQAVAVLDVFAEPAGLSFTSPVTIVFAWKDADPNDGIVDGTTINERDLFITKYGALMPEYLLPCGDDPDHCDTGANTFTITVTSFSEFDLAAPQDTDDDGVPDNFDSVVDNCPLASNPGQENTDGGPPPSGTGAIGNGTGIPGDDITVANGDSLGDACDPDNDNDGIPNGSDSDPGGDITYDDNGDGAMMSAGTPNDDGPSWDANADGILDGWVGSCGSATADADGDGLKDAWENCKWGTNPSIVDSDNDGIGDCTEAVDTNGNGIILGDFGSDGLNSARATLLPAGVGAGKFGKDGDFDLNGNMVVEGDFGADTLTTARMTLGILPCQ